MFNPARVKFVKSQEDRPGYKYSELLTDHFLWRVETRSFEVIHGLSRIVELIPDKLVLNRKLFEEILGHEPDSGWIIRLVLDLLRYYRRAQGEERPIPELPRAFSRSINVDNGDFDDEDEAIEDNRLDLVGTLDALLNDLTNAKQLTEVNLPHLYWEAAQGVAELADRIRESCMIYLELIHPFMVESRRPIPEEVFLDTKAAAVRRKIVRSHHKLLNQLHAGRHEEYRED